MKKILAAIDGSAGSDRAVEEAVALARALDAELVVVSVFRPPASALGNPYYDRSLQRGLHQARVAVASALVAASESDVDAEGEVLEGDPAEEIVRLADRITPYLIVIGSRGHGRVAGAILGSVSSAVLRNAPCPVVAVTETARRRTEVAT